MGAIDDIKARLDIVDVISAAGVNLRKSGRSLVGFCPFHPNTRTPAFTVYPDSQSFYCFGCHAAGTVFDFVMRKQGLEFRAALEQLAAQAGVQLAERSDAERAEDRQRTRLLEINAAAARYFNYILTTMERGAAGRAYVERRGLSDSTIESFQLGYSRDEWSHLLAYLTDRKGYEPEEVVAAGLAIQREQGGYYDRFRGRLVFPIRNAKGETVGFGGRALGDAQPKYLNTPQTPLFDKGSILYGLDLARDAIRLADATVVVEGYVDVLTAHQHGFRNVVAPLGTALTKQHIALLKRLSHNVYLALDADAAGQKATLRGLSVLQEDAAADSTARPVTTAQGLVRWQSDVNLKIIKLPAGRDPDDVIRADPAAWRALQEAAQPVMDFYLEAYTADLDLQRATDQSTALERLMPLVGALDGAQQRAYIARIEQIIGIRAELILDLLRGNSRTPAGRSRRQSPAPPRHAPASEPEPARKQPGLTREDHLLALLLHYPAVSELVATWLSAEYAAFPAAQTALGATADSLFERADNRVIWQRRQQDPFSEAAVWAAGLEPELREQALRLVRLELPRNQELRYRQDVEQCLRHLRLEQARRWQRRLAQQAGDSDDPQALAAVEQLIGAIAAYLAHLTTPRRTSTFSDLRDTLPGG